MHDAFTVPRAGTLIGTLKAKVPSRDMGLTTDIHPCAQIVSEWLSAMSYNAYMLAKHAGAGEVAYFGACHFKKFQSALLISKCLIKVHFDTIGLPIFCCCEKLSVVNAEHRWSWPLSYT